MRGLYKAEVGGASVRVRCVEFRTVRECREFAEGFGSTADWCNIYDWKGRKVGEHRRHGAFPSWFRVAWQPEWKVP
jgi:hypothetical protein